jgi:hypothetical protein
MVLFSDGSFSDDLYPEDITVSLTTGIENAEPCSQMKDSFLD